MGRPRKPDALKILHGDRADRINRNAPVSTSALGDPPEWFGETQRATWSRVVEACKGMGLELTRADAEALALYCEAHSTWLKARKQVATDGLTVEGGTSRKAHTLISTINETGRQMVRILSQFGMTPSSRSALDLGPVEGNDPLLSFLAAKKDKK